MLQLQKGKYFGVQNQVVHLPNLVITDTEYTHDRVDWHCHQNPYFTFIIEGNIAEINKKERYECNPGTVLFHHRQDEHCNIKYPGYTRGFHIEAENGFFDRYDVSLANLNDSLKLDNVVLKSIFRAMYIETKINDDIQELAIQSSLLKVFELLTGIKGCSDIGVPMWVKKVKEALHQANTETLSWEYLSIIADIHPMHLSRDFPKYFHANVGDYIRKIRIEKAINLIRQNKLSLTAISYQCGFADQSHFIRSFRSALGVTPLQYKKLIA